MTTFVLVHGGFGSSAELAPVIPELEALGHHAIAVDLPSTDPAATLDDYAAATPGDCRAWRLSRLHSTMDCEARRVVHRRES